MNRIHRLEEKLEKTSRQRRENLCRGRNPARTKELDERLEELRAELRTEKARSQYGDRDTIVKQARVERELEKLMKDD